MDMGVVLIRLFVNTAPVLAALYMYMGIRFWRYGKKNGYAWFAMLLFCCASFALEYYFEMHASDIPTKLLLRSVSVWTVSMLPAFGILYIRRRTKKEQEAKWLSSAMVVLAFMIGILFILNPYHSLFYKDVFVRNIGGYSALYLSKGPMYFVLCGYFVLFVLYGIYCLWGARHAAQYPSERRRYLLLIFFLASMVPGVLWQVMGLERIFDPTPVFLLYLGSVSLWGGGKNDLMQTQLARWDEMYLDSPEPAFLFSEEGEQKKSNLAADRLQCIAEIKSETLKKQFDQAAACKVPVGFPVERPVQWMDVRKSVFGASLNYLHYHLTDITDKRSQHQRLRSSEEQYRLLITQMQQGLAVFEADERKPPESYVCLHGNEAFAKSVGVACASMLPGLRIIDVFPMMDEGWRGAIYQVSKGVEVPRFERYWAEKKRSFGIRIYAPLPGQVAVILSDITDRKSIEQELRTKDKLLLAVIGLTQDLLGVQEYEKIIPRALALVGEAMDTSRGYLFECAYQNDALHSVNLRAQWSAPGILPLKEHPLTGQINSSGILDFLSELQTGKAYAMQMGDNAQCDGQQLLIGQDMKSLLVLPVFAGELFWGFVGFDECRWHRNWTTTEQGVLRLFADSLGRAVERYMNELKLRSAQERNTAMLHAIPDLFFIITREGKVTHYHASIRQNEQHILPERFLDKLVTEAFPPSTGLPMLNHVRIALSENTMRLFEFTMDMAGQIMHFEGRLLPINQESVLLLARDITERKRRLERIEYLSYHDQLTGLYNRRRYKQQIMRIDKSDNLPLAVIMADLNGLKLTNDAFGHQMGDLLLTKTADVLLRVCPAETVYHMGGDEFVILLPHTGTGDAEMICRSIQKEIGAESTGMLVFSISIGYAVKRTAEESISDVFRQAEDDMYRHKLTEGAEMRRRAVNQILQALYQRSPREMQHSKQVGELSEKIARAMGLGQESVSQAYQAGLMHDIGKIGIDQEILEKSARLNDAERREMRRHSEVGYRLLNAVHGLSNIAPFVLEHHERWDGTGYPKGITGEKTTLISRIIAVADCFDAMISPRTYKEPITQAEAIMEVKSCAGKQFDPQVARAFVEGVMGYVWDEPYTHSAEKITIDAAQTYLEHKPRIRQQEEIGM